MERRFQGRRILVAVDRLDYTKGIPERLRAYRRLLESAPALRGSVTLIQVAIPSRQDIASYAQLRSEVNEMIGEINGQFGTPDWTPIVYMRRGIPHHQLTALYAAADVAWVAPLRDGMNLVAKEYVATKVDSSGALVLSEFAGAAEEMGEAFTVNPYDEERTAATVERVLSAGARELRDRMSALHARVLRNNVFAWADRFLGALREAAALRAGAPAGTPPPLSAADAAAAYRAASSRALFLDYDGTLVTYASTPQRAVPTERAMDLVTRLAADPANTVVLISGRRRADLEEWFGAVPGLWLAAEHGAYLRRPDSEWLLAREDPAQDWKQQVRPILEQFVDRTPGSFIEEKELSLVWHHRLAEPEFGEWLANELVSMLDGMLAETELRAIRGRKVVEVKPVWANKGEAVSRVLTAVSQPEFRFAAGDDRTDEDLFAALDAESWTVHVGRRAGRARYSVRNVSELLNVLEAFARPQEACGSSGR